MILRRWISGCRRFEGTCRLRHYGPSSPREPLNLRRSTKATADRNVRLYLRENIETRSGSPVFSKAAHDIGPYVLLIIGFYVVIVTRAGPSSRAV